MWGTILVMYSCLINIQRVLPSLGDDAFCPWPIPSPFSLLLQKCFSEVTLLLLPAQRLTPSKETVGGRLGALFLTYSLSCVSLPVRSANSMTALTAFRHGLHLSFGPSRSSE